MRHIVVPGLALALGLALASVAAGQSADAMHNATRLGGWCVHMQAKGQLS